MCSHPGWRRPGPDGDRPATSLLEPKRAQLGYNRNAEGVGHNLRTAAAGVVYVADAGRQVVGLLAMSVHRQFHWKASIASVDALVIDRAQRSRGVGTILLDAATAHAERDSCILIEVFEPPASPRPTILQTTRIRRHQCLLRQASQLTDGRQSIFRTRSRYTDGDSVLSRKVAFDFDPQEEATTRWTNRQFRSPDRSRGDYRRWVGAFRLRSTPSRRPGSERQPSTRINERRP